MIAFAVALLAAQSCVGEAGFGSAYTGECAAIVHVYVKRSKLTGVPLRRVIKKYSAAIKPGIGKKWVRSLKWRDESRPKGWDKRLRWSRYKSDWLAVCAVAEGVLSGAVKDPAPTALHYGGPMDRFNLNPHVWSRVETPRWGNYFYERKRK